MGHWVIGPYLCVSVWESAGAEWRCGSVLYVGMLRVLCSVVCYIVRVFGILNIEVLLDVMWCQC